LSPRLLTPALFRKATASGEREFCTRRDRPSHLLPVGTELLSVGDVGGAAGDGLAADHAVELGPTKFRAASL
jgi:hypothetical protein